MSNQIWNSCLTSKVSMCWPLTSALTFHLPSFASALCSGDPSLERLSWATLSKLDSPLFPDHAHVTVSFFIEHITTIYIINLSSVYYFSFILDNRDLLFLVTQLCLTVCSSMDCSLPGSSVHGDSPGKNIGVGCHALLQGIFPTQGMNPGLWIHIAGGFITIWATGGGGAVHENWSG